jgi:hypothetical protein
MEKSMYEQTNRKAAIRFESGPGWLNWAGRHPGFVVLGALVVAILAFTKSPETRDVESDPGDEEVPLFI